MNDSSLPRYKGLVRKKPMPRGTCKLARTAMKPGRPKVTADERIAKRLVHARSDGWCEIRIDGICFGRATDWHHRKNRSQGGLWLASDGLRLCRNCHHAVTATNGHRTEYEANGWIVPRNADPAKIPVLMHHHTLGHDYLLLHDDGTVTLAPFPAAPGAHPDDLTEVGAA